MTTQKRTGRPKGRHYPHTETLRLTEEESEFLAALALEWDCSRSEAVRRLLALVKAAVTAGLDVARLAERLAAPDPRERPRGE